MTPIPPPPSLSTMRYGPMVPLAGTPDGTWVSAPSGGRSTATPLPGPQATPIRLRGHSSTRRRLTKHSYQRDCDEVNAQATSARGVDGRLPLVFNAPMLGLSFVRLRW